MSRRLLSCLCVSASIAACAPVILPGLAPPVRAEDIANQHCDTTIEIPMAAEDWQIEIAEKAWWYDLTSTGNLFVMTKKSALGLSPDDGHVMWEHETFKKLSRDRYEPVAQTPFVLLNMKDWKEGDYDGETVLLVNTYTGEIVWSSHTFGVKKAKGHVALSELGLILLYAETYVEPKRWTVMAVDLMTGAVRWTNDDFFAGHNPADFPYIFESGEKGRKTINELLPPLWVGDSAMVLFATEETVTKFNPFTGDVLAQATPKPEDPALAELKQEADNRGRVRPAAVGGTNAMWVPSTSAGNAPLRLDPATQTVYLSFDTYLAALDLATFTHRWAVLPDYTRRETSTGRPGFVDRFVRQVEPTAAGVFVHATKAYQGDEIALLDPATGEAIWSKYIDNATNILPQGDRAVVFAGSSLLQFDVATGAETILCEEAKFHGGEDAVRVEPLGDGYLVFSEQNAMRFDAGGKLVYHYYSSYAKKSLLTKIATGVAIMALNVASAYAGQVQANQSGFATYRIWDPVYYMADHPGLVGRFAAEVKTPEYLYVPVNTYIGIDKKPGVAKVSKRDGCAEIQVRLGKKNADYRVDTYSGKVFLWDDKKGFTCWTM